MGRVRLPLQRTRDSSATGQPPSTQPSPRKRPIKARRSATCSRTDASAHARRLPCPTATIGDPLWSQHEPLRRFQVRPATRGWHDACFASACASHHSRRARARSGRGVRARRIRGAVSQSPGESSGLARRTGRTCTTGTRGVSGLGGWNDGRLVALGRHLRGPAPTSDMM
jgi:hypothetical protein